MSANLKRQIVFIGVLLATVGYALADQDPVQSKTAALKEFRAAKRKIDKLFIKCPVCKGRGTVAAAPGGRKGAQRPKGIRRMRCIKCFGEGMSFDGSYQTLLDAYVDLCDLIEKKLSAVKLSRGGIRRIRDTQSQWCGTIMRGVGVKYLPVRVVRDAVGTHRFGGYDYDGPCTKLACDLILSKTDPTGCGIAFDGKIMRVAKSGERSWAQVLINTASKKRRTCIVAVPASVRWVEDAEVRVVGRIVDDAAARKGLRASDAAVCVTPYDGTK